VKGFVKVASLSALADDSALHVEVGHVPVCLARSGGEVMAILDECSHAEVSLSDGEVENCTIECWLHGSRFDLRTGKPTGLPATEAVPVYPVRIDGDDIYVAVKE
jgi:3-phenylpropionate/trans-cinnamate dioxygenase ferredoxin component